VRLPTFAFVIYAPIIVRPLSANSDFADRQPGPGRTRSAFAADVQVASDKELESLIRRDFERCHPGDTLDDLKRRAAFSKEDRGLLRDWMSHRKRCGAGLSAPASR
jgi:hypothetical protein